MCSADNSWPRPKLWKNAQIACASGRHRRLRFNAATIAIALSACSLLSAQELTRGVSQPLFRAGVDLVTLHVTVTDGFGRYLTDVSDREIMLFENGRQQELSVFQEGGLPLAVTLLLDISSSMQHAFPEVREAAMQFVRKLEPSDIVSFFAFGDRVRLLQGFTNDPAAVEKAIAGARPRGGTALYDALYIALKELNRTTGVSGTDIPRRRVAVVLSDGDDTTSLVRFEDVLDLAARSDTAIYVIRMGRRNAALYEPGQAEFVLRHLTRHTGGRAFFSLNRYELSRVYDDIRTELARQYALAYVSNDLRKDGGFRSLSVQVVRPGARAQTRRGYFAPTSPKRPPR